MASHIRDDLLHGKDHEDTHASANRSRHQESSSYAKHAGPREADQRHGSRDLSDFLNSSRVEPPESAGSGAKYTPIAVSGNIQNGAQSLGTQHVESEAIEEKDTTGRAGTLEVNCGPLLNYRRMENKTWFGSVLIVTRGGGLYERSAPVLVLKTRAAAKSAIENAPTGTNGNGSEQYGTVDGVDYSSFQDPAAASNGATTNGSTNDNRNPEDIKITGTKLYSDPNNTFWRFSLEVPMQDRELHCEYSIPGLNFTSTKTDKQSFYIPAIQDSMRIMFHSCNGFSVGTDEEAYSGACLWNDVQRVHKKTPFHVM